MQASDELPYLPSASKAVSTPPRSKVCTQRSRLTASSTKTRPVFGLRRHPECVRGLQDRAEIQDAARPQSRKEAPPLSYLSLVIQIYCSRSGPERRSVSIAP